MDANTLLNSLLRASPVVQTVANSRVFPVRIPQSSPTPAVCFMLVSRMPQELMKGVRLYDKARAQVSIFADDFATLSTLADGCRAVLDGYRGQDGTTAIVLEMEHDQFEDGYDRYHRVQDYRLNIPAPSVAAVAPPVAPTVTPTAPVLTGYPITYAATYPAASIQPAPASAGYPITYAVTY